MKRTDILKRMTLLLDNLDGVCTNKLKSDALLTELERYGMLPPLTTKLIKYEDIVNGERSLIEFVEQVNEWDN